MHLNLLTLPKLAVSAKLLICLLMVVSSESVPPVARSVTLYNQCSCSMLRVNRTGAVAADNSEDGYEKLIIQSRDYSGKLLIYGEKSKRYLCFNPRWKLVGSKKVRGRQCYFREEMVVGGYYRYRSTLDRDKYLGFLSSGRQLRGRKPPNPNCLNWVKIDLGFSIGAHNEEISKGPSMVSLEMFADRRVRHSGKHRLHKG